MRTAVACCAALATAVGVGACGTSVPSNAVAVVGNATVTKAQFAHWMTVANDQPYVGTGEAPPAVPVPPDYTACIASERTHDPSGTAAALMTDCKTDYTNLNGEVTALLVEGVWFQGEAVDRDVKVTQAQINAAYTKELSAQFTTTKKLNTFLAESGYTVADLKWVAMLNLLQTAIVKKVEDSAGKVTAAQIAAYYKAHVTQYTEPERRNIELVLVSSAATAATVKSLLAGGASFASIAKQYSIDPTTKDTGGVEQGVEQGEETPIFNAAIFAAPIGVLQSTGKTPFGYYVFKVTGASAASVGSLKTEQKAIKLQLTEAAQTAAVDKLRTTFLKKWRSRTTCASGHLISDVCGNAPATASTGASGTT
jgi:foldase protein PrsA